MRAVRIHQYGTADELHCDAMPVPEPGPGEVLVRQHFAGVNFADVYMRNGLYHGEHTYGTQVPFTLGLEGTGVIEAVGKDISHLEPGMRVGYCLARGGYADFIVVPADRVIRLPDWCADDTAAALMLQGATSHYLTHSLFRLEPGHACLIHAGAGGVGQLLIQIAKARGAFVIATVGSQAKAELARSLGADQVILYRQQDVLDQVQQITDGAGVDVVYDSVGKDTIHISLRCLKVRGTCALFGASSGPVEAITPMELAEAGSVFLTRPHLAHYRRNAEEAQWRADDLFDLLHDGRLTVAIDSRFPLEAAAEAHRRLESRASSGKILLAI
ncbi:quinone oxidoreductase family protein [Halomonas kalidii]|uniref:Quinone oxidoreductase n=1 Tax=Halomonas kalidii TaxID=3043293 RepID=A0ABT6VMT4_9GAMM|nr:quinone oxidoreductase [Halomonas kalidii]MDI5935310.1 quinone oxidoreductase [Halomonas kalidii]